MKKMLIPCLMLTAVAANANVTDLNYPPVSGKLTTLFKIN